MQGCNATLADPQAAEIAEICVKFGVQPKRARLLAAEVAHALAHPHKIECDHCGKPCRAKDPRTKYCSESCKTLAYKARVSG